MVAGPPRRRVGDACGSGPVSAVFGVAVFLTLLLVATQVLVHLYTTSTVTAAAFDAARRAAAEGGGGCEVAPDRVRALLGAYGAGPEVEISCVDDGQHLTVRVSGPSPARAMARTLGRLGSLEHIERAASVRLEAPGEAAG